MPLRAPGWAQAQTVSSALRASGRTDLAVYRLTGADHLFYAENGITAIGDAFGPARYEDFLEAVYTDEVGPFVDRHRIGAIVVMHDPLEFPAALQRRLREEMRAIGFREIPAGETYDAYLAPAVRS